MELSGKRVLVTGGAVRIGRAICLAFAAAGARVSIHCHNSLSEAEALLAQLGPPGGHQITRGELTDTDYAASLFESLGGVDILVNNASMFQRAALADEDASAVERQMAVNFLAPLELMKRFHAQGLPDGLVVNLLDQRIWGVDPLTGSYALSKKALAEATFSAALSWAPRTRVNGVAPGPVFPPKGLEGPGMRLELGSVPLGRAVPAEEVAAACLFLARSGSVTGQVINVDGGQHLIQRRPA